jgi:hypothetical protein
LSLTTLPPSAKNSATSAKALPPNAEDEDRLCLINGSLCRGEAREGEGEKRKALERGNEGSMMTMMMLVVIVKKEKKKRDA